MTKVSDGYFCNFLLFKFNQESYMNLLKIISRVASFAGLCLMARITSAADAQSQYPAQKESSWVARDFRFHSGEVLPELRLNYTTLGVATNDAVLILHGTTGSGTGLLSPAFGGELFGPGQPLEASRY